MAQLSKENNLQKEAFEIYYHLGDKRSLKQVAEKIERTERTVAGWSRSFNWVDRVKQREIEDARNMGGNTKVKYSSNVLVLIVSVIVGVGGTALTYLFLGIPFTSPNVVCMVLMAVAVWVGAMLGYDKVLQMIDQIKSIKK